MPFDAPEPSAVAELPVGNETTPCPAAAPVSAQSATAASSSGRAGVGTRSSD